MSARPLRADELLRLAATLAGRGKGAGRPRTVELRRGVSTAYYGVFHELCAHGVELAFGREPSDAVRRSTAARWIAHTDVRALADAVTTGHGAMATVLTPVSADLTQLAATFADLQDARHDADYNHDYAIDKRTALDLLTLAEDAVASSRRM